MNENSTAVKPGPDELKHAEMGVGEILAQARQSQGLTVDDIANQLKFSTRQIEALEAGRFEQLPSGPFVRGIVRGYARLVDLDPGPLLAKMAEVSGIQDTARIVPRFSKPVPFSDSSRRSSLVYVALSLVVLAVAAIMVVQWRQERPLAAKPAPAAAPVVVQPPAEAPSLIAQSEIPPPPPPAPPQAAVPKPQPIVTPRPEPIVATAGRQRVGLRLDAESWIEIKDATGATLVSQLMPEGSERTFEGEAPLSVVIGNAHYVHLTHNGKPVDLKPHIKVEVARLTLK